MNLAKRSLKEVCLGSGMTLPVMMLGSASAAFFNHRPEQGFFLMGIGMVVFLGMWSLYAFLIKKSTRG